METNAENSELRQIPIELIERNPENPRTAFRQEELDELMESIAIYGVQVPISMYRDGKKYILIDGERRWLCSLKLNKKTIPALVQKKPDPLDNLLLMFNIHALREQWDYLSIALKLPRVIDLLEKRLGQKPNERIISQKTGLTRGAIRRCKLLIELPKKYQDDLLQELHKPKSQQKLSEDLFLEMERSLNVVQRTMPEIIKNKDVARNVLINKYKNKVITDIVDFRELAKIGRAENVAVDKEKAQKVLVKLFENNTYSIKNAYSDSVSIAYDERELATKIEGLIQQLADIKYSELDKEVQEKLRLLFSKLQKLLADR